MKILAIGDIVGEAGRNRVSSLIRNYRSKNDIDLVIANGENVSAINGICASDAQQLFSSGIDVITGGNHSFGKKDIYQYLDTHENLLRPVNYPAGTPGSGYTTVRAAGYRVLVINVLGVVFMSPLASPFESVEKILDHEEGAFDVAVLDAHAEATAEKLALGRYFDGRIDVVFGTHTHVATADEQILPGGTGYITDIGMSGPRDSILGAKAEDVIERFTKMLPHPLTPADGEAVINGALFTLGDCSAGNRRKVTRVERVTI